ncbi:4-alpha-glucanotransferase [Acholeplasma sp. OttesenSCG-928-E16]|nr:4-alpha-glucanotransferase [Acholeplasma sp. OttesenSCG-928-E16]
MSKIRESGILLHVSSLPSPYGIGTFGSEAYSFIDFLNKSKQAFWQILPLGHTSFGDSPYQTFSAFAGNPYFIDLDFLVDIGLLKKVEINIKVINNKSVDYKDQYEKRYLILMKAYKRFDITSNKYQNFKKDNAYWLYDYAFFMAIKEHFKGVSFQEWPDDIKKREIKAMDRYQKMLFDRIEFYSFLQYNFYEQWYSLKEYANKNNIKIIGDMPIYVALDSSDVWARPYLFDLNEDLAPNYVAGVPPDKFSEDGQLWGNPLYNWDHIVSDDYNWWIERLKNANRLFDLVRIDHFIGFENYFCIKFNEKTARNGFWKKGPGIDFFKTIEYKLGKLNIIAEDLGNVTDEVRNLLKETNYPGMKLLQFAFDAKSDSDYLPHHHPYNSIVYTGTHDNETTRSWFDSLSDTDLDFCLKYINANNKRDVDSLVKCALTSVAKIAIIPLQDYLGLDNSARMNTPATLGNNWKWRALKEDFDENLLNKIKNLTILTGRSK